jgi:hypothetical protein
MLPCSFSLAKQTFEGVGIKRGQAVGDLLIWCASFCVKPVPKLPESLSN